MYTWWTSCPALCCGQGVSGPFIPDNAPSKCSKKNKLKIKDIEHQSRCFEPSFDGFVKFLRMILHCSLSACPRELWRVLFSNISLKCRWFNLNVCSRWLPPPFLSIWLVWTEYVLFLGQCFHFEASEHRKFQIRSSSNGTVLFAVNVKTGSTVFSLRAEPEVRRKSAPLSQPSRSERKGSGERLTLARRLGVRQVLAPQRHKVQWHTRGESRANNFESSYHACVALPSCFSRFRCGFWQQNSNSFTPYCCVLQLQSLPPLPRAAEIPPFPPSIHPSTLHHVTHAVFLYFVIYEKAHRTRARFPQVVSAGHSYSCADKVVTFGGN